MIETSPQNRHLGYARVSTYGQTLDAQLQQFRAEGCAKIYREKARGPTACNCAACLCAVVVSAHVSLRERKPAPLPVFQEVAGRAARRSRRVTVNTFAFFKLVEDASCRPCSAGLPSLSAN